jgi:hypothetical protein
MTNFLQGTRQQVPSTTPCSQTQGEMVGCKHTKTDIVDKAHILKYPLHSPPNTHISRSTPQLLGQCSGDIMKLLTEVLNKPASQILIHGGTDRLWPHT